MTAARSPHACRHRTAELMLCASVLLFLAPGMGVGVRTVDALSGGSWWSGSGPDGDDDFEYDSPVCDRYGFRDKGRHVYAYCKYSYGERASAFFEEYQEKKRACDWVSVERGAIQTTYTSYEERVEDTPYSYDMFDVERFPNHVYKPITMQKCQFETTLGDVFVERAPFHARKNGEWEQIHTHILEDVDLERYDHYFKGSLLVASYADGEILVTPPVHYHHSHLFAAYDRTNMQLPHYDTTETHGDGVCAEGVTKYAAQCLWNLNPPGYYHRMSPTLMRDERVDWFFDFWGFGNFTQEAWRGFGFNGDINLVEDIPIKAGDGADEIFWEFAIIMKKPDEDEVPVIVDTINIGPQFTLTPFQRAGTYSVPYDEDSVVWGTYPVCDNAFMPCEIGRFKFHAHDNQELWIYDGSMDKVGLYELENYYDCHSYDKINEWLFPFNASMELAGGSVESERARCQENMNKYPQLSYLPLGLRSFHPEEHGTTLEAVQENIRRKASKNGAELLWELRRDQGVHGTQAPVPMKKYSFGPGAQITMIAFTRPGAPGKQTMGDHRKHFELYLKQLRQPMEDKQRQYWDTNCIPCSEMTQSNSRTCVVEELAPPMLDCRCCDMFFLMRLLYTMKGLHGISRQMHTEIAPQIAYLASQITQAAKTGLGISVAPELLLGTTFAGLLTLVVLLIAILRRRTSTTPRCMK